MIKIIDIKGHPKSSIRYSENVNYIVIGKQVGIKENLKYIRTCTYILYDIVYNQCSMV